MRAVLARSRSGLARPHEQLVLFPSHKGHCNTRAPTKWTAILSFVSPSSPHITTRYPWTKAAIDSYSYTAGWMAAEYMTSCGQVMHLSTMVAPVWCIPGFTGLRLLAFSCSSSLDDPSSGMISLMRVSWWSLWTTLHLTALDKSRSWIGDIWRWALLPSGREVDGMAMSEAAPFFCWLSVREVDQHFYHGLRLLGHRLLVLAESSSSVVWASSMYLAMLSSFLHLRQNKLRSSDYAA